MKITTEPQPESKEPRQALQPTLEELSQNARLLIRLRWVAGFGILIGTVFASAALGLDLQIAPLLVIGLGVLVALLMPGTEMMAAVLLVQGGLLPLARLVNAMAGAPNRRFGIPGGLAAGQPASLSVWDLAARDTVDPARFLSMGRSTPFEGWQTEGRCLLTLSLGRIAYREGI